MKTTFHAVILLAVAALLLCPGCKTPEDAAYKISGTAIVTVDKAMSAYAEACRSGLIASNRQEQVHAAYDKYHAAILIESNAVVAFKVSGNTNALYQAAAIVTASSADVIALVQSFLPPPQLLKLKGSP